MKKPIIPLITIDCTKVPQAIPLVIALGEMNKQVEELTKTLDHTHKYQSKHESTRRLHRELYALMVDLDRIYREDELRAPTLRDYADSLADHGYHGQLGHPYSPKMLRELIREARKNGW